MNKDIPSNAKPYSIDIKSMYSNIIIEEGLEAFEEALEKGVIKGKKLCRHPFL